LTVKDFVKTPAARRVRGWPREGEIVVAASGSVGHAGLVAELLIEDLSGIAVDVEYASEYSYRSEKSLKDAAVIVVSQSGETADTLSALRKQLPWAQHSGSNECSCIHDGEGGDSLVSNAGRS